MSNVNDVVDVTITIEDPVASSASYSNMLLVLPAPKKAKGTIPDALPVRSDIQLQRVDIRQWNWRSCRTLSQM